MAGPVVAASVIMPMGCMIPGLNDCKKLTRAGRGRVYPVIVRKAVSVGVAGADPKAIDEIGIRDATHSAMREAVDRLLLSPEAVIVDGTEVIPGLNLQQYPLIRGDQKSNSVAAASIVAKVVRDRIMCCFDEIYPEFSFCTNVGYGTRVHRCALRDYGPTPLHRISFLGNFDARQIDLFSRRR